ncbi:hypothetical protein FOA43_001307 [Brettanomyces nanus]|uniref:Uncharacterized protein n=1 Tax=Eeniella nana TaxID=13502 RepID=A0A875RNP4_EENNA|nr:uncharacterized protein FOA43_001307 [Brettanomyces nanus]QPG73990.1 hypothetical protein FOA43_001307 [Brettanomyces nanus]
MDQSASPDTFSDLFTLNETTLPQSTDTTTSSWVESFYQTIIDPSIDTKAVTLLTESPINADNSSPTISRPSTPYSQKHKPSLSEVASKTERRTSNAAQAINPGIVPGIVPGISQGTVSGVVPRTVPGAVSGAVPSPFTAVRSALPSPLPPSLSSLPLQLLKDGLTDYVRLLDTSDNSSVVKPRTDFLVGYLKQHAGVELRSKIVNEYLAKIKKDDHTNDLLDSPILANIRSLLTLTDKRRKSYNKRRSQRRLQVSTSTPNKHHSPSHSSSYRSSVSPYSSDSAANSILTVDSPVPCSGLARTLKVGFCRHEQGASALNFVYLADFSHISQVFEDETYLLQLRNNSRGIRDALNGIYNHTALLSHPITYMKVPLRLTGGLSVDIDQDRMVSYVETLVDLTEKPFPQNFEVADDSSVHALPTDYVSFVQLKAVTCIYAENQLITRKTDPVTGYFVSPSSRSVRVMLPLQAGVWAAFLNDFHNGIVDQSRFQSLYITQTLFRPFKRTFQPLHSFIWDFTVSAGECPLPICVTILKNASLRVIPSASSVPVAPLAPLAPMSPLSHLTPLNHLTPLAPFPRVGTQHAPATSNVPFVSMVTPEVSMAHVTRADYSDPSTIVRCHKRTRSRSLNELDTVQLPFSSSFAVDPLPTSACSDSFSLGDGRRPSDWSLQYSESPLHTPADTFTLDDPPSIARDSVPNPLLSQPVMFRLKPPKQLQLAIKPPIRSLNKIRVEGRSLSVTSSSSSISGSLKPCGISFKPGFPKDLTPSIPRVTPKLATSRSASSTGVSIASVAKSAEKAGCSVDSFKLQFDGNYKFRYYNPESKTEDAPQDGLSD